MFLAASLHATIILGIGFSSDLNFEKNPTIEVTLALSADAEAPEEADFIAQANQQGSGDAGQPMESTTTERAPFHDNELREVLREEVQRSVATETSSRELLTAQQPTEEQVNDDALEPKPEHDALSNNATYEELLQEIASLEARIAQEQQAQAQKPRVKRLTSVSAKSASEAAYLNMWREKVERVGNANFPSKGVFGSLRLLVILQANGQLTSVRVLESSGSEVLDSAAVRIVRMSSPFQPFPIEMRRQYDQLEIIRTWVFSKAGTALGS